MAKTRIGFDIGNSSLKIAVDKKGDIELHEIRLPEHMVEDGVIVMPNAFSDFLKKTRRELNLPKAEGGLIIPENQVICRLVTMPKMTEAQLLMNLPYEFSDFIQGETDQYYCDYAICEENDTHTDGAEEIEEEPEMTMMAAAVSKARIQEYVRMFAQAGISLKMLLPQEMALIELVGSYCERRSDAQKEYCFIDLGYHTSRVIIVRGDRIQAVRQIDLGTFELDMVIADIMDVDTFLADTYKRKNYMDILNHERCQEYYGRLAVEILKVINFYQFTFRESNLDGIYLIGGGANIQPLQTVLEDVIGMPAFPVTTLIPGEHKDKALCATGLLAAAMTLAKEGK